MNCVKCYMLGLFNEEAWVVFDGRSLCRQHFRDVYVQLVDPDGEELEREKRSEP